MPKAPQTLHEAILAQDHDRVRALLAQGADPNGVETIDTPLWAAVGNASSALNIAILCANAQAIDLLLEAGASLEAGRPHPPVMEAVGCRNLDALKRLHEAGAGLDEVYLGQDGGTLLHMACTAGDAPTTRWLLEHGLDPDARDHYGFTALQCGAMGQIHAGHVQCILALLDHGAAPDCAPTQQEGIEPVPQPLGLAINHGQHTLVGALLEAGANPNAAYAVRKGFSKPRSSLSSSIWMEESNPQITRLLVDAGAWLGAMVEYQYATATVIDHTELDQAPGQWKEGADSLNLLHLAAACDRAQDIEVLHEAGLELESTTRLGMTPLLVFLQAATQGTSPNVERTLGTLLRLGANPHATTAQGETALHLLAKRYNSLPQSERKTLAMIQAMIGAGCDPMAQDQHDMTALDVLLTASDIGCAGARMLLAHMDHAALDQGTLAPMMPRPGRRL